MTIDEAIKKEHELSKDCPKDYINVYHKQLAEWLEELKAMRNLDKTNFSDGYEKGRKDTILSVWKKAIAKYDEGLSLEELDEILDEVVKEGAE